MTAAEANVVTPGDRATVPNRLTTGIELRGRVTQEVEEPLPEVFRTGMQTASKATFAQPGGNIAVGRQEVTTLLKAAAKDIGGHHRSRHPLGGIHCCSRVFSHAARLQKLVTETVNCDNAFLHGCFLHHGLRLGTQTVAERQPCDR